MIYSSTEALACSFFEKFRMVIFYNIFQCMILNSLIRDSGNKHFSQTQQHVEISASHTTTRAYEADFEW